MQHQNFNFFFLSQNYQVFAHNNFPLGEVWLTGKTSAKSKYHDTRHNGCRLVLFENQKDGIAQRRRLRCVSLCLMRYCEGTAARLSFAGCCFSRGLYIVVQIELMRVGPQFNIVDFMLGFIVNPHVNGILGEDITLHEKLLVGL